MLRVVAAALAAARCAAVQRRWNGRRSSKRSVHELRCACGKLRTQLRMPESCSVLYVTGPARPKCTIASVLTWWQVIALFLELA